MEKLLKGHIQIRDSKTKEILVDKDNMILEDGRAILFYYLITGLMENINLTDPETVFETAYGSKDLSDFSGTSRKLNQIFFGSETVASTASFAPGSGVTIIKKFLTDSSITKEISVESLSDGPVFKIHFLINGITSNYLTDSNSGTSSTLSTLSEVGLILSDNAGNHEKYFSRAVFDPLTVDAETSFDFEYFIYF